MSFRMLHWQKDKPEELLQFHKQYEKGGDDDK